MLRRVVFRPRQLFMSNLAFIVRTGRLAGTALLLATSVLQTAFAYDSAKLEAALESLTAATFPVWEKRAREGDPVAQNVVGMAYKYGEATAQDHSMSLHWFLKAGRQGDADAQFNLGRIYGKATGSVYGKQRAAPRDDGAAVHWYRIAAEQNYGPAQRNLAEMYAEGSPSVQQDLAQAAFWMWRAAAAGDQALSSHAEILRGQLTAIDLERLQTMEVEWERRRHRSTN